jgi:hypothetical protein
MSEEPQKVATILPFAGGFLFGLKSYFNLAKANSAATVENRMQ